MIDRPEPRNRQRHRGQRGGRTLRPAAAIEHDGSGAVGLPPLRNRLLLLSLAILLVVVATAYGQIRLNRWNQPFYDALSHRQFVAFLIQLGIFGPCSAGALLVLQRTAQQWLGQMLSLKLREGLVSDLVQNWLLSRRAFRLAHAGSIGVNPDQRDARRRPPSDRVISHSGHRLTAGFWILLAVFVDVLWSISSGFALHLHGATFTIPGYMVWAALVYAGSASLLSYWVGRGLINRNAERYARRPIYVSHWCGSTSTSMPLRWRQAKRKRRGGSSTICKRSLRRCAAWLPA